MQRYLKYAKSYTRLQKVCKCILKDIKYMIIYSIVFKSRHRYKKYGNVFKSMEKCAKYAKVINRMQEVATHHEFTYW